MSCAFPLDILEPSFSNRQGIVRFFLGGSIGCVWDLRNRFPAGMKVNSLRRKSFYAKIRLLNKIMVLWASDSVVLVGYLYIRLGLRG